MIESLLIKHIDMVVGDEVLKGDILVQDGKIVEISPHISQHAEVELKESGLTLLPGVIDPHVHFRDPGVTEKEDLASGSYAAAAGGVTSFFEMPNTRPSATTRDRISQKKAIAAEKSIVNYNFFIGASLDNLDELVKVDRVPGIKIFVGSSTGNLLVAEQKDLRPIFEQTKGVIAVHSEDEEIIQGNYQKFAGSTDVHDHYRIRNVEAAMKCTKMLVQLAKETQHRLHICHLTTADEAEFLTNNKENGLITTEVSPQHLFLYAPDIYDAIGTFAQINPPIREKRHSEGLQKALRSGIIDFIGTDHAPHLIEEKELPFGKAPAGMPMVQYSLPIMLNAMANGFCDLPQLVKWMSSNAAQCYNIKDKGYLHHGYDADMVLVDLNATRKIDAKNGYSKAKWSAFDGQELKGWPIMTFVNGQMVYREGDLFTDVKGKEVEFLVT